MLFEDIPVIAIDQKGTKRMEDAYYVDRTTKEVCIVSIRPNFQLANIQTIMRALHRDMPAKKPNEYFFDKEVLGISREAPTEVFIRYSAPPYTTAIISLGSAHIAKSFSFEEADALKTTDRDIELLYTYAKESGVDCEDSKLLVSFLIRQLNESVMVAMKQERIPYLSHLNGGISMQGGIPRINRPFRDAVSFINAAQLWHWLRGDGVYFPKQELEMIINRGANRPPKA